MALKNLKPRTEFQDILLLGTQKSNLFQFEVEVLHDLLLYKLYPFSHFFSM